MENEEVKSKVELVLLKEGGGGGGVWGRLRRQPAGSTDDVVTIPIGTRSPHNPDGRRFVGSLLCWRASPGRGKRSPLDPRTQCSSQHEPLEFHNLLCKVDG